MGTSMIDLQRNILLQTIRATAGRDEWKVLVLDEKSQRIVDNVAKEDDILNENVTNVEQIEKRRQSNPSTDAVYLLTPLPHIVECLKADLKHRRYRRYFLIWTSPLPKQLHESVIKHQAQSGQIADSKTLDVDIFPQESHLVTFREPSSLQILFHPGCDGEVAGHLNALTRKIVSICVSLGEYPIIKYYRPRDPLHDASVLCSHLAGFVQSSLDQYAKGHPDFPPQSSRPQGILFITDRSMDLMSPLVHEFTYQAMAMDLLPIRDDEDKVLYRNTVKKGTPDQEEKDVEISEKDKIWVANRHMHMKDLLGKIVDDFNKFRAENPQFAEGEDAKTNVDTIKDMLAGLPQFQEGKEAFSLHLEMAEKCVNIFQSHKLPDIASVEQSLATGLDEDYRKPKNLADQLVRLLDDDSVVHEDRLRLLIMYTLNRNGILDGDIEKLRRHAELSELDREIIYNLQTLGGRIRKGLKDVVPPYQPLFKIKPPATTQAEEVSLSRFEPAVRYMLEEQSSQTLDPHIFPPVRPMLEPANGAAVSQTSLRSAGKPTWARTRPNSQEPRQRMIVFMAGGATYAEARACYEVSHTMSKEVFLVSSHMLTPKSFLRQVGMFSAPKDQLDLPTMKRRPRIPKWVAEADAPPRPPQEPSAQQKPVNGRPPNPTYPPVDSMRNLSVASRPAAGVPRNNSQPSPSTAPNDEQKKEKKKHLGLFKKRH